MNLAVTDGGGHLLAFARMDGSILGSIDIALKTRYAAELGGDEAEHRVLGQSLAGASPPNSLGFEVFEFSTVSAIEGALKGAGFGLGQQGSATGRFYDFPSPPMPPPIPISGNTPT
jgi:Haem degrading protein HbpS-like